MRCSSYFPSISGTLGIGLVLLLTGCASNPSVSEFQCKAGDWQSVGYRDGSSGYSSSRILQHQEACGEYEIVPDRSSYLAGWREGLDEYCTAQNGFDVGRRGGRSNSVCSANDYMDFVAAYSDGRDLYEAGRAVRSLENQLVAAERRLEDIKHEIVGVTTAQLEPGLSAEERLKLVVVLESLIEERSEVKDSIPVIQTELARSRDNYDRLNSQLTVASRY